MISKKELLMNSPEFRETLKKPELPQVESGTAKEIKHHKGLSFWDKKKLKDKPDQSFLIEMIFSNGTSRTFVIATKSELFTYKKKTYYLRYQDAVFDLTNREWKLIYHDDHSTPIQKEIVMQRDPDSDKPEAYFSVHPSNLKPIIRMEYVKALAESQEISKYFKIMIFVMAFGILLTAINLYMTYKLGRG
jgi:hypothetical protein